MTARTTGLDIVTVGESMVLLAAEASGPLAEVQRFRKMLAGAETNVAIGLTRLGLQVGWLSRLGTDSFGDFVLDAVRREGVDVSRVSRDPTRSTGFMLKTRTTDGSDPAIEYYRRGSAASGLSPSDFDEAWFTSARHLHVTGISPALSRETAALIEHAMARMRAKGRTISFDPNLRPRLWPSEAVMRDSLNRLATRADWVMPGLAEGRLLTGQDTPEGIARFYLDQGVEAVVVKLGPAGAYVATRELGEQVPGFPVQQVVDTVGAGDGFAAGFISARLEGLPLSTACRRGNWVGAQAVQVAGDMDGLPYRDLLPPGL